MVKKNNHPREHPPPEEVRRGKRSQLAAPGGLTNQALKKYWPGMQLSSHPSAELDRLLRKVEQRLQFHRDKALAFAVVRGAIQTELSRREM
jgi:hypothetical protein